MATKLNDRQIAILAFIEAKKTASIGQIFEHIQKSLEKITKITISRDLEKMLEFGLIERQGAGRAVTYQLSSRYPIIKKIDVEKYFAVDVDQRKIKKTFDFGIFDQLKNVFTEDEKRKLSETRSA